MHSCAEKVLNHFVSGFLVDQYDIQISLSFPLGLCFCNIFHVYWCFAVQQSTTDVLLWLTIVCFLRSVYFYRIKMLRRQYFCCLRCCPTWAPFTSAMHPFFWNPTHIMEVVAKAKWLILYFSPFFFWNQHIKWLIFFALSNCLAPGYGMETRQRCVVTKSSWIWVRHVVQLAHRCFSWKRYCHSGANGVQQINGDGANITTGAPAGRPQFCVNF